MLLSDPPGGPYGALGHFFHLDAPLESFIGSMGSYVPHIAWSFRSIANESLVEK